MFLLDKISAIDVIHSHMEPKFIMSSLSDQIRFLMLLVNQVMLEKKGSFNSIFFFF